MVDRPLALRPAAGAGSGGEDDGVGARHRIGELLTLDVAEHGLRADRLEVARVVGVADHSARPVAALSEHPQQVLGDLAVASDDDDVHDALLLGLLGFVRQRCSRRSRVAVRPGSRGMDQVAACKALVAPL